MIVLRHDKPTIQPHGSERKHEKEALHEREVMLQALSDNLPDAVLYQYVVEPDGRHYFTYLSAGADRVTGIRREDAMRDADAIYGNLLPEDHQNMMRATQESATNLTPFLFEARRRLPSGEIRWMSYRSRPRRLPGGATVWDGIELDITERKRVEEALRQSEERFSKAFNASSYPMAIRAYPDLRYIDVNESFVRSRGYSREEIIGRTASDLNLVLPEDEAIGRRLLQEHGELRDLESRIRRKDGEVRTILLSAEKIHLFGMQCLLVVSNDITERKRAEEELQQSEERFSKAFQASPYPISIRAYPDLRYVDVNESFIRSRGYSREEVIGRTPRELNLSFPEEEANALSVLEVDGTIRDLEARIRRKDGEVRTVLMSMEKIHLGGQLCLLVVSNDITERKQAEAALQESEARFRAVAETAACAIMIYRGNRFLYVNPAEEAITGYSRKELLEMDMMDVFPPESRQVIRERWLARQRGEPVPVRFEYKIITKGGQERWIDFIAGGFIQYQGKPAGLGTAYDITEQKRAQQEREELIVELQVALSKVKMLSGFLPICATCKNIRNDEGYWQDIEDYISDHSEAEFSHGVCPECAEKLYPGLLRKKKNPTST